MSSSLQHLLVLCCHGGQPFVDFQPGMEHQYTNHIDPTEWVAADTSGVFLENSSLPLPGLSSIRAANISLSRCDLFNVSFLSTQDQLLFDSNHAQLGCRCPPGSSGVSCESLVRPLSLALSHPSTLSSEGTTMVIVFAALLLALFVVVFMMFRGCFCDCFGPWSLTCSRGGEEPYDKPLDPRDVENVLRKYREHEARQEMREQNRPLVATISQSCPAPYNTTVLPSAPPPIVPQYRASSPPPSYSSLAGSRERIPTTSI